MEPLLLVCGGCGVKIRANDPDGARTRACPQCGVPLAATVAKALQRRPDRSASGRDARSRELVARAIAAESAEIQDRFLTATAPSRSRSLLIFGAAAVLLASSLVHLSAAARSDSVAKASPPGIEPSRSLPSPDRPAVRPIPAGSAPLAAPEPDATTEAIESPQAREAAADLEPEPLSPPVVPPASLALRDPQGADPEAPQAPPPASPVAAAGPDGPPSVTPPPSASPGPAPGLVEPRRLLVRDPDGKAVVAREYGKMQEQMAVVLPDGTIGWPMNLVYTDDPFQPSSIDDLEKSLLAGEYATFRVIKTEHYLVFYQSTERFARESADLLEKLFERLTGALRKQKVPVTAAEFPLVAVIFRSEEDFRANRQVPRDVLAYYEILSNRIFFFENGRRDSAAPEVSAFRRPQTVAHEGTHQLLHNIGIQPRMSPWPIWFVEGLAEYCSPPKSTRKGGLTWDGLGQVNPIHLTTIRDLDDPMSQVVRGGPKPPSARDRGRPLVEYLVTRTELTPTDYALSWGLTHYLAVKRVDQFIAYIRKLNQLKPFETRTPEQQLADFREIFGKNLAKLDTQVADHLDKLRVPDAQALPYYAVLVEQPLHRGAVRRMAMVSQSPSVINQWFDSISGANANQIGWNVTPFPNRTRAVMAADTWIQQGH